MVITFLNTEELYSPQKSYVFQKERLLRKMMDCAKAALPTSAKSHVQKTLISNLATKRQQP